MPAIRVVARVARELFYRAYFLPGAKAKCIEQTLEQSEREGEKSWIERKRNKSTPGTKGNVRFNLFLPSPPFVPTVCKLQSVCLATNHTQLHTHTYRLSHTHTHTHAIEKCRRRPVAGINVTPAPS